MLIAWLIARTNLPGRSFIEVGCSWVAFFLPSLTVTLSWILLLDPDYGLINTWLARLPFVGKPFNIYSFWGIVWVHVITGSLTVKVILLTPAFRNMNAAFEEASRVAGASTLRTALRITVPVMAPAILSVLLLGTMVSLQTFEVEQVLGLPFRFFVFSTMIYDLLVTRVPRYDAATALAVVTLAAMLPLVLAQQWLTRGRRFTTITGQFQNRPHALGGGGGRRRSPGAGLAGDRAGRPAGRRPAWHVHEAVRLLRYPAAVDARQLDDGPDRRAVPALARQHADPGHRHRGGRRPHPLADRVHRGAHALRRPPRVDPISWLPFTVPGIILGLALLWLCLDTAVLRPLYGSMTLLIVAGVISGMPLGVQIIKSGLLQLGAELEEASRIAGASWWSTYRRIVLRLMTPTLVAVGMITFVGAARNIGNIALLATSANRPLSILSLTTSPSASWRPRWWWPASSCSSRSPAPCWPGSTGCAATSAEGVTA